MTSPEAHLGGGAERRTWRFKTAGTLAVTALTLAACGDSSGPCEATFERSQEKVITMPDGELIKAGIFGNQALFMEFDAGEQPSAGDFMRFDQVVDTKKLQPQGNYESAAFQYDAENDFVIEVDKRTNRVRTFCEPVQD